MEYIVVVIKVLFADWVSLSVLHIVLFFLLIYSLHKDYRLKRRRQQGISDIVTRGERSMGALCFSYSVVTIAYSLAISASECIVGYKATFIVIDYVVLTYIFFNSWFRNDIVFKKWLKRIRED